MGKIYYNTEIEKIKIEELKNDQILIMNKVNDKYNIYNYKFNDISFDIIYEFNYSSIENYNNKVYSENGNKKFILLGNQLINIDKYNYSSYSFVDKEEKTNITKNNNECCINLSFKILEDIFININFRYAYFKDEIKLNKIIKISKDKSSIFINDKNNFDIILDKLLNLYNDIEDKTRFLTYIKYMNCSINDYLKNNDNYKFFIESIKTNLNLKKIKVEHIKLNEYVNLYFPIIKNVENKIFIFVDNENNEIQYIPNEVENKVIKTLIDYYYEKREVMNPISGKFDRRIYKLFYKSKTGCIIGCNKGYSNYYYLLYNNLYYRTCDYKNDIKDEYEIYKKLIN